MLYEIFVYKESSNFESFWEMQLYLVPGENWEQTTKPTPAVVPFPGAQLGVLGVCTHNMGLVRQLPSTAGETACEHNQVALQGNAGVVPVPLLQDSEQPGPDSVDS